MCCRLESVHVEDLSIEHVSISENSEAWRIEILANGRAIRRASVCCVDAYEFRIGGLTYDEEVRVICLDLTRVQEIACDKHSFT